MVKFKNQLNVGQVISFGKFKVLVAAVHFVNLTVSYDLLIPKKPETLDQIKTDNDLKDLLENSDHSLAAYWTKLDYRTEAELGMSKTDEPNTEYYNLRTDYAFRERMFNVVNSIDSLLKEQDIKFGKIIIGQYKEPLHILIKVLKSDVPKLQESIASIEEHTGCTISIYKMNLFERFLNNTIEEVWK